MRFLCYISFAVVLIVSCYSGTEQTDSDNDSTSVVVRLIDDARSVLDADDADSAFSLLLKAEPYLSGCGSNEVRYDYHDMMARLYERKNLFSMQERVLQKKLADAAGTDGLPKQATTYYELGVSRFAQADIPGAVASLNDALSHSPIDSVSFMAQCYVMLGQVYLQTDNTDSLQWALNQALTADSTISAQPVYRLAEVYSLYGQGEKQAAADKINGYLPSSPLYARIELLNLLATIHEEQGNLNRSLSDLRQIIACNDSAAQIEASENTAKIHRLRHEEQMKSARLEQDRLRAESRARTMTLVGLLAVALAAGVLLSVWFARRAVRARQSELEALSLAEDAQAREAEVRSMNQELQQRYYSHLYAILLPILNAKRTKTGFIDLNEKSWRLIEENTDMVLPNFTSMLRKNHPSLADDDVRFCCLVVMQVPNPVIASVYGIAPSSVSVRKQRMKKKLDEAIANETLEHYLSKYSL